jgi:hypothetical protein
MMQEIRTIVIDRLKTDGNLYPSLVDGGIYDRKLSKEKEGGTPAAFAPYPGDLLSLSRVRNSIVILGPNDVDPPDGPVSTEDFQLRNGFLRVFYYVPAHAQGKIDLDRIDGFTRSRLGGWQTMLSIGTPVFFQALDMVEAMDSDEWDHTLVATRRFLCEWIRPAHL